MTRVQPRPVAAIQLAQVPARVRRPSPRYAPPPPATLTPPWNIGTGPFSRLGGQTRALVAHYFKQDPANVGLRRALVRLANGTAFGQLAPDVQRHALDILVKYPRSPGHHDTVQKLVTSKGFTGLDSAVQKTALDFVGHPHVGHSLAKKLFNLLDSSTFRALGPAAQRALLASYLQSPKGIGAGRATVEKLANEPAFERLSAADQALYISKITDPNPVMAKRARGHVDEILSLTGWDTADTETRQMVLEKFAKPLGSPDEIGTPTGTYTSRPATYNITKQSSTKDHERYEVRIGSGKPIKIYVARGNAKGLNDPSATDIARALARMPPNMRGLVREVYVTNVSQPDALMDASVTGRINVHTQNDSTFGDEFTGVMVHEAAHHFSRSLSQQQLDAWDAAIESDGKWPTFYAGRRPDEDRSETIRLYTEVVGTAREREYRKRHFERFKLLDKWL